MSGVFPRLFSTASAVAALKIVFLIDLSFFVYVSFHFLFFREQFKAIFKMLRSLRRKGVSTQGHERPKHIQGCEHKRKRPNAQRPTAHSMSRAASLEKSVGPSLEPSQGLVVFMTEALPS